MLEIVLTITVPGEELQIFDGSIGNISSLAALSNYCAEFQGRSEAIVSDYPRWSEPVRGLVARCIEKSESGKGQLESNWVSARIDVGLNGGGRHRRPTRIAMVRAVRSEEDGNGPTFGVSWIEGRLRSHIDAPLRTNYSDPWDLAQHMLKLSVWLKDQEIPSAQPIVVPVHGDGKAMRTSDLPEPVRSAFERRQRLSGRPFVDGHWDCCWIWDWTDFLDGQR